MSLVGGAVPWNARAGIGAVRGELLAAGAIVGLAAVAGYLVATDHRQTAYLLAALPAAVCLLLSFRLAAVLLAVSLPFPMSLLGGMAGLNVAASDLLLALLTGAVALQAVTGRSEGLGRAVRPAVIVCAPYVGWMAVLVVAHHGVSDVIQSIQRLELFLIPIIVGAAIALLGHERIFVRAYVFTSIGFAALYPFFSNGEGGLGAQKNPAGQFIANALILMIALPRLRSRGMLLGVPVLVIGLLWTQSRGAVLSVAVALAVLAVMHRGRERGRFLLFMIPLVASAVGAFALLPSQAQQRNLDFNANGTSAAARSVQYREEYKQQAWAMIHQEPLFGVGVGNYVQGTATVRPTTVDPHDVLLLQAAEGGYPFFLVFGLLIGGAVLLLARHRRHPLAAASGAVLIACVGHGLVDVYWVRGTPVLAWVLLGLVMGKVAAARPAGRVEAVVA